MKINLNNKTFRIAALAGLMSLVLSTTSSTAQTTPEMQTMPDSNMSESMTPEQMRQQHQQMLGQMQQRMGQMQQQVAQMTPEQLQQHHQKMMEHMEQMMGQMDNMMMDNSMTEGSSGMLENSDHHPGEMKDESIE